MLTSSKDGMLGCGESGTVLMGAFVNVWSLVNGVGGNISVMMESMKVVTTSEDEEEVEWLEDMVVERHQMMRGSASSCPSFILLKASAS
jgi:hypothetical protein